MPVPCAPDPQDDSRWFSPLSLGFFTISSAHAHKHTQQSQIFAVYKSQMVYLPCYLVSLSRAEAVILLEPTSGPFISAVGRLGTNRQTIGASQVLTFSSLSWLFLLHDFNRLLVIENHLESSTIAKSSRWGWKQSETSQELTQSFALLVSHSLPSSRFGKDYSHWPIVLQKGWHHPRWTKWGPLCSRGQQRVNAQ